MERFTVVNYSVLKSAMMEYALGLFRNIFPVNYESKHRIIFFQFLLISKVFSLVIYFVQLRKVHDNQAQKMLVSKNKTLVPNTTGLVMVHIFVFFSLPALK